MKFRDRQGRPIVDAFSTIDRRHVLRGLSAIGAAAVVEGFAGPRLWAQPVFASTPFALGVASGEPAPDGFVAWTRLAPKPLEHRGGMPARAVEVEWVVAGDDKLANVVRSGKAVARPELGHALHIEVAGLEPGRHYFYGFRVAGHHSRIGRAKTLPPPGAALQRVRFAAAGCQRYDDGYFTAWRHIAEEDVDFVFHYGDYIYEYGNARARATKRKIARPLPGDQGEVYSLDDYRRRYAAYQLDPDLQAAHAAHTFLPSFDDHEVDSNWAGANSEERGVDEAMFHLRRMAAFQAWYETMPLRRLSYPRNGAIMAYRRLLLGDLAAIDVLDTRQYRSAQACGGAWKTIDCAAANSPEQKIIGDLQEKWILDGFAANKVPWTVLAQQVIMMERKRARPDNPIDYSMDKWDGARLTRKRLLEAAASARKNLVVLSGDLHDAIAGTLHTDFTAAGAPAVGTEFVVTSISSDGDGVEINGGGRRMLEHNPHLKFWNGRRGYLLNTLTHKSWQADFRSVQYVQKPGAAIETKQRFTLEPGNPNPQG